ncbi:MAG: (2Fe-2S) ferredoxin domain-containing protein [Bacteroidales bacterium]|jgi:NADP-reducing hydrogenase subunit HndB|nr:(2Fe-2S) ferredoxin domain-containing protein [Bacteroidales bacterium]
MAQIKSLKDLESLKSSVQEQIDTRVKGNKDGLVQIKVAMATCGISAGAKSIYNYFLEKIDEKKLDVVVYQTDCMGRCNEEPTVEVALPNQESVIFGNVDKAKVDEILEKFGK